MKSHNGQWLINEVMNDHSAVGRSWGWALLLCDLDLMPSKKVLLVESYDRHDRSLRLTVAPDLVHQWTEMRVDRLKPLRTYEAPRRWLKKLIALAKYL